MIPFVRPDWNTPPLPLLDHFGVCRLDQGADSGEHLAPPITQFLDSRVYQLGWGLGFLRPALLHETCLLQHYFVTSPARSARVSHSRPWLFDGSYRLRRCAR